jgi:hypothetical protein
MTGALDASARATAQRMLATYGKACTLKQVAAGAYDTATGTVATTPTSHPINAYLDQPNRQELAGGQVLSTDEVAVFPAQGLSVVPAPNDLITVDGADRLVKVVGRVWSGELVALWRCALRS